LELIELRNAIAELDKEQEEKDRQNARKAEPKSRLLKIVSPKLYLALKDMGKLEKML